MTVSVRRATADDYDPLCGLFDEIDTWHRDNLPRLFQKPSGPIRERDYYLALISDENVGLFVADTGKELVGFVHAIFKDAPPMPIFVPRHYAIVDAIVVKASYQNQGTGKILMNRIQDWAVSKGASSIELNVYEFNETAISFYEKLGYQTLSRKMSKDLKTDEAEG
jgi:diamine N-acetyltransferase